MSILVTGGAGFIGSHLIELLAKQTVQPLVCLDNFNDYYDPRLKRANAETLQKLASVSIVEGDFCDVEFTHRLFGTHNVEQVVHLGRWRPGCWFSASAGRRG